MDVKFVIIVLVAITFRSLRAVQSVSPDPDEVKNTGSLEIVGEHFKCKTKIGACKIRTEDIPFVRIKGDKGESGDNGQPGRNGREGDKGPPGLPGSNGARGEKGERGDSGEIGPMGPPGIPGPVGLRGEKGERGDSGEAGPVGPPGLIGMNGLQGLKGERGEAARKGDQGFPGRAGQPGTPGRPGTCSDYGTESSYSSEDYEEDSLIMNTTCKFLPITSGFYNFSQSNTFEAYCNMSTKMTCLIGNAPESSPPADKYILRKKAKNIIWLSQMNAFDLAEVYGLERDQILWLKQHSTFIEQTMRINTKNLIPYDTIFDNHIYLLSWNEKTIGPMPTKETPFFYSVLDDVKPCTVGSDKSDLCTTDIKLVSEENNRLPIIDIRLNDATNDDDQYIYVENIQLCVG